MKSVSAFLAGFLLLAAFVVRAQDAATEERINKLSGQIEDLIAGQKAHQKQISDLSREIESLRELMAKPSAAYASQEDLKSLAEAVREVDQKRVEDAKKTRDEVLNLAKLIRETGSRPTPRADRAPVAETEKPQRGYEYEIQQGDTLSVIVQAYREKNVKVTVEQVLKANPGLKPEALRPGQKIFIPAAKS